MEINQNVIDIPTNSTVELEKFIYETSNSDLIDKYNKMIDSYENFNNCATNQLELAQLSVVMKYSEEVDKCLIKMALKICSEANISVKYDSNFFWTITRDKYIKPMPLDRLINN